MVKKVVTSRVNFYNLLDLRVFLSIWWHNSWLKEYVGSMPHSQELSNNLYPERNQPNFSH